MKFKYHDAGHLGATDDGGEDGAGRIITSETGFAHTGAVVDDESCNFLFGHFGKCVFCTVLLRKIRLWKVKYLSKRQEL